MKFVIDSINNFDKSGYEVIVETMAGDGDGWEDIRIGMFKESDLDLLENLVILLDKMLEIHPKEFIDKNGYNHIEGFSKWFGDWFPKEGEPDKRMTILGYGCWAYDIYGNNPNSIEGYRISFWKNGQECNVRVHK